MKKGLIIGASMGNCVHVAGAIHFLDLAEDAGYQTLFLGPAVSVDNIIAAVLEYQPQMVTLGYRLTPKNVIPLIEELQQKSKLLPYQPRWLFGGTRPVAEEVRKTGFFEVVFDGTEDLDDCISFLRTGVFAPDGGGEKPAQNLRDRILQKSPYPILRHHFGLPDFEATRKGIEQIADSRVLDVISLGIDQNTQQYFFHPEQRRPDMDGAGGVPVKSAEEFAALKAASQRGNYPLMRCYSGTSDVLQLAQVLQSTIDNAWCAVPLCWYNELDGRGTRKLEDSMRDAQKLIAWHGQQGIPLEVNEPHHWGLRDAHDVISVAMSYISAYNAKKLGIKDYVSQYMFNVPGSMSFSMDLAKVQAQIALVDSLADNQFTPYREVRAGLPFLSADINVAKGQLAASTMLAMQVNPNIIHVVGYSEAEFAATPDVVIESCKIVRGVIRSTLQGNANATYDPAVMQRKTELLSEVRYLLDFIKDQYSAISDDPLADAHVLSDCVKRGILDAPHIVKKGDYKGNLHTRMQNGKCLAYDPATKQFLTERQRLNAILQRETVEKGGVAQ